MTVLHYADPETGQWFREIKENSFAALDTLKKMYEKDGHRAWINHWFQDKWVLTVVL